MFSSTKKISTDSSAELFERAQLVAPGGVHSPVRAFKSVGGTPVFFESAQGAYLTSVEQVRYTDFCLSFGPLILGHRDPHVTAAIHEMVDTAWTFGACEPYSLRLAEKIKEFVPFIEKLRFVASGTEAVMTLARLARAATGRKYLLKFDGCYHGHVDSMLVKAGSGLAGDSIGLGASDSAGVTAAVAGETLVAPLDNEEAVKKIFEAHGSDIAAIFIEPLPANYGLLIQRESFLNFLREISKQYGALLVFDEVISGFRVGPSGMAGKTEIVPDLVAYGKVLGGGFNVACYGGPAKYLDLMAPSGPVYQAGTLSANPVGMVAGYETLCQIQKTDLYSTLAGRTARFAREINDFCLHSDLGVQVDHYESIFWLREKTPQTIRSYRHIPESHAKNYKILFHSFLTKHLYFAPSGYEVGFLSAAHTDEVIDDAIQKICQVLKSHESLIKCGRTSGISAGHDHAPN